MAIHLTISGQTPSGKNAMQVAPKTGVHYPNKRFKEWRTLAMYELKSQIKKIPDLPIVVPVSVYIKYWAGDNRRRDVPGIIDALWHVIEKMGIVIDDELLGGSMQQVRFYHCGVDKSHPRVEIDIL